MKELLDIVNDAEIFLTPPLLEKLKFGFFSSDLGLSWKKLNDETIAKIKEQIEGKKIRDNDVWYICEDWEGKLGWFDGEDYISLKFYNFPVLEINGIRMQVIKGFENPFQYWEEVKRIVGENEKVLNTCFGLGYSAIAFGKCKIVSFEIKESVVEMAKINPWSRKAFKLRDHKLIVGDVSKEVEGFEKEEFDFILHDPPTFKVSSPLYGRRFYKHLYRILKKDGWLFHYIGKPYHMKGRELEKMIVKKLMEVGFKKIFSVKNLQAIFARK